MDQGVVAENNAVVIMYGRQIKYALKSDYVKRIGRGNRAGSEDVRQYSWASFVAQLVKNLPAMQETWV